jgi:hypothetical protein
MDNSTRIVRNDHTLEYFFPDMFILLYFLIKPLVIKYALPTGMQGDSCTVTNGELSTGAEDLCV